MICILYNLFIIRELIPIKFARANKFSCLRQHQGAHHLPTSRFNLAKNIAIIRMISLTNTNQRTFAPMQNFSIL